MSGACGQCLWRVATIVEKGVIRGGIAPLILGALTVLIKGCPDGFNGEGSGGRVPAHCVAS